MQRILAAFTALLLLLGPARAQTPPPEKPNVSLVIGAWAIGYLPLPIAEARGYFKEEGLTPDIRNFNTGGTQAMQALVGGSTDLAFGAYEQTLYMQMQNKPIRCAILLNTLPGAVLAVRKDLAAEVKSVADLKGRKVGVTALGSATEYMLRSLAAKAGLGPRDVTLVAVGVGASSIAAIEQKSIDAIVAVDPAATILDERGLVTDMVDARTLAGTTQTYGGDYPTVCLYTFDDFMTKNPATMQHLVNALAKALAWINAASTDEIVAALPPQYVIGDKATFTKMVANSRPMFPKLGNFSAPDLIRIRDVLGGFNEKMKEANVDVTKTFTNRFVDAVPH